MLAATVDVGDVFPRAQCLDGHELGGFQMVWFHPGNRKRRDPAGGRLLPDTGSADRHGVPEAPSTTASAHNTKVATANGHPRLRPTSWMTVTTNPTTPIAKAASSAIPTAVAAPFRGASRRRAVIQESKRKQPHRRRGHAERHREDEGAEGDDEIGGRDGRLRRQRRRVAGIRHATRCYSGPLRLMVSRRFRGRIGDHGGQQL